MKFSIRILFFWIVFITLGINFVIQFWRIFTIYSDPPNIVSGTVSGALMVVLLLIHEIFHERKLKNKSDDNGSRC